MRVFRIIGCAIVSLFHAMFCRRCKYRLQCFENQGELEHFEPQK